MFSHTYKELLLAYFQGGNAKDIENAVELKNRLAIIEEEAKKIAEANKQELAERRE